MNNEIKHRNAIEEMVKRYRMVESMYEKSQNHKKVTSFYKFCSTNKMMNNKLFNYLHDFVPLLFLIWARSFYLPLKNTLHTIVQNHNYIKLLLTYFIQK